MHGEAFLAMNGALWLSSCAPPERSASGFRLPEGDVEAGRAAFVELQCYACHEVKGMDFPGPVADPPVPRGPGRDGRLPADGWPVRDFDHQPSHRLAPGYPAELVQRGEISRMADYSDVMTVRQLVDLAAFLHSRYEFAPRTLH